MSFKVLIDDIGREFLYTAIVHNCSLEAQYHIWKYFGEHAEAMARLIKERFIDTGEKRIKHLKTIRRGVTLKLPSVNSIQIMRKDGVPDIRTNHTVRAKEGEEVVFLESYQTVRFSVNLF
jgi:hypothetical protein